MTQLIINCPLSVNKTSFTYLFRYTETSFQRNLPSGRGSSSCRVPWPAPSALLPLPAPAPAASAGASSSAALRWAGCYVDLSLLDLAAGLWQQVLDLLLRFQVEHHVSELLLQLLDGCVLQMACRTNRGQVQSHQDRAAAHWRWLTQSSRYV